MKLNAKILALAALSLVFAACSNGNDVMFFPPAEETTEAHVPKILSVSGDTTISVGRETVLSVDAWTDDSGTLTYQWFSGDRTEGITIDGATGSDFSFLALGTGTYRFYCEITNRLGESEKSEVSQVITVTAEDADGTDSMLLFVMKGQRTTLGLAANSVVQYQWYEAADSTGNKGMPLDGADSALFTAGPHTTPGIHYYYCSVRTQSGMSVSPVMTVAYTGLPALYLDLDRPLASVTKDDYALGKMRIVQPDGTKFEYEFTKSGKEGIKGRGNYTWSLEKKGYNIKFDKKQEFFGLPAAKKWCITANHADKTLLRNKFASDVLGNEILGNAGGEWSPHFMSVDVVVNGEYRGNYLFGERITLTEGRVDVQDISEVKKDKNGDGAIDLYDGGFIMEVDCRRDADFWFDSEQGLPFTLKDPDEVDTYIQEHIKKIVNTAENAIFSDNFADEAEGYAKYIDVDSFIDWYIVNELTKNLDAAYNASVGFNTSVYMYYNPEDGKLHMGPNWDFDVSCGATKNNDCYLPEGWYVRNAKWFAQLFKDTNFTDRLKTRWNTVRADIKRAINTEIPSLVDKNRVSANLNFTKWNILGTYFPNGIPGYETRTTYQSEVDWMIDFLNTRYNWLDGAIEGL